MALRRKVKRSGDDEARRVVFERDGHRCRRCGAQPVEWCHVFTRGWRSIRHDPANAFAGCRDCHEWFDSNRKAGREWWESIVGADEIARLRSVGAARKPVSEWRRTPKEWGAKNSAAQRARYDSVRAERACSICGKPFIASREVAKTCGSHACKYASAKATRDDIGKKAMTAGSSIRMGPGKKAAIDALFRAAIGRPCTYCGAILTLSNSHIDHKTPVTGIRGLPIAASLDAINNLQIICRKCNIAKSNLNDEKFRKLLAFLRSDPELYEVVWRRLGMQGHAWSKYKGGRRKEGV